LTYTSVFAVPRSTAMALTGMNESNLKNGQRIYLGSSFGRRNGDRCDIGSG
jgi:hypothetical protein